MSMSLQRNSVGSELVDGKDRVVIKVSGGRVAIARFPDMSYEDKKDVANVYSVLTGFKDSYDKVIRFLNYETEENVFCS